MDERQELGVRASLAWYEDVFRAHGIPTRIEDGLWSALGDPPRWHSAAKSLRPDVPASRLVHAVDSFASCSVADSYGTLDLSEAGFRIVFEATWLFLPAASGSARPWPDGWVSVTDDAELTEWNSAHDTSGVLLPALLRHPRFTFLARRTSTGPGAGAVLARVPGAVELSNTWALADAAEEIASVLQCAQALFPDLPLVGYAHGDELDILRAAGFRPTGPLAVWVTDE